MSLSYMNESIDCHQSSDPNGKNDENDGRRTRTHPHAHAREST